MPVRLRNAITLGAKRDLNEDLSPADFELQPGEAYRVGEVA